MAINKVVYGDTTLIDLTGTTATPSTIVSGYTAFGADGNLMSGTHTEIEVDTDLDENRSNPGTHSAITTAITEHTENQDIHVTTADKHDWSNHLVAVVNQSETLVFFNAENLI